MTATETPTSAITAQGFKVEVAADIAGVADAYAEIGGIPTITLPDDAKEFHDFITNSSPEGTQESVPKKRRIIGDTTFELHANPGLAVQTTLNGFYDNDTLIWMKITNRQSTLVLVMIGYISKRVPAMDPEQPQKLSVTFHPSGPMKAGSTYRPTA